MIAKEVYRINAILPPSVTANPNSTKRPLKMQHFHNHSCAFFQSQGSHAYKAAATEKNASNLRTHCSSSNSFVSLTECILY